MILFPIAFLWIVLVIVWVVRNEIKEPGAGRETVWTRRRPRRPRGPRPHGRRGPRSGGSASVGRAHAERRAPR